MPCSFSLGAIGQEIVPGLGSFNSPFLEIFRDVPQHVGAVDCHGYGPDALIRADLLDHPFGKGFHPAFLFEQRGQVFHPVGLDPRTDKFLTGMHLEAVRRIAAQHTGFEHGLGVDARTAGNRGVDHFDVRIFGFKSLDQRLQSGAFISRPPGKNFYFAFGRGGHGRRGENGKRAQRHKNTEHTYKPFHLFLLDSDPSATRYGVS